MKTAGIKVDDLVKCDVKGRIFFAEVKELGVRPPPSKDRPRLPHRIRVKPITPSVTWTFVTANQIIGHYAKRKGSV
jgi:hypothetical protein